MNQSVLFIDKKEAQRKVEDSYVSNFYGNAFKDIINIAEKNETNPAQLSIETEAYIEGNSKGVPTMDKEKINEPFYQMRDAYVEQATEDLANAQVQKADDEQLDATFKSQEVLEYVTKNHHPYKVRGIANADFDKLLTDAVSAKQITASEAIELNKRNVYAQVQMLYQDILNDSELDEDDILKIRQQLINGTTGIEAIDRIPQSLRMDALDEVFKQQDSFEASNQKLRERAVTATGNYIEDKLIEISNSDMSGLDRQLEINKLKSIAKNKEQLELISKWNTSNWESNDDVMLAMEEAERNGTATREFYQDLHKAGLISTGTYRAKLASLNDFLNQSMKQGEYKEIEERLKAAHGYKDLGENEAYHQAKAAYISYLSSLGRVATRADHEAGYDQAMKVAKAFPGVGDPKRNKTMVDFYDRYNISFDGINAIESEIAGTKEIRKKIRPSDYGTSKYDEIVYGEIGKRLLKDNIVKTPDEANMLINDYKNIKRMQ